MSTSKPSFKTKVPVPVPWSLKTKVAVHRSKLCGGAIIEVRNLEQAVLAECAGARCVLVATQPSAGSGCTTFNDLVMEIKSHLSIPVMARVFIGHTHEMDTLESMGCEFIYQSEPLNDNFLDKHKLRIPCVCACQNLGEALRRIEEGAAMIRIQGETSRAGAIGKTVKNLRVVLRDVYDLSFMNEESLSAFSAKTGAPPNRVEQTKRLRRIPVPVFAGGGIATGDDVSLLAKVGCDGVFVGSEIFDGEHAFRKVKEIVRAVERAHGQRDGMHKYSIL